MRRTGFKIDYAEALKRKQAANAQPRTPLKRGRIKRGSTRLKPGRKVKRWNTVRAWLKLQFEKRGITSCEFGFIQHECWRDNGLGFAHSHKRTDPNFEMYAVALACPTAHQILDEVFSHGQMAYAVHRAIENHGGVINP